MHKCAKRKKIKRKPDGKKKKSGNYMVLGSTKYIKSEKITKNRSGKFKLLGEKIANNGDKRIG